MAGHCSDIRCVTLPPSPQRQVRQRVCPPTAASGTARPDRGFVSRPDFGGEPEAAGDLNPQNLPQISGRSEEYTIASVRQQWAGMKAGEALQEALQDRRGHHRDANLSFNS